ncbi:MAG: 3-deoxy-D-manno-octulosonic acid transferase [Gammaproteobacteria bacterium]|nr:3-deoxy-D-manno-octulosonic acid transferase [Gammaproteobacteria bacterium]
MSKELFRYRLLLRLLAPLLLIFNAWQAARAGELRLFRQRLGTSLPQRIDAPLWLHAASVGELIAAQALITILRERFPHVPVTVTTVTPTGAALAQQRLPADVQHLYLPMDWPGATRRFLRAVKPRAALIMETELWPNLFENIARQNIPLIIINGRLSSRSRHPATWIKKLYAVTLKNVDAILARSADDADAYIQLGAPADKVHLSGNIKWANTNNTDETQAIDLGRPYVLAASTHDNEEQQLAHVWEKMAQQTPQQTQGRLLVIAPRHPQRRDDILKQLTNQTIAIRSRGNTINADTKIYLADTLGELEGFIAGADCVFMGGSLIPHGGHNILEPARLGKPIVFGPHMTNFTEETQLLLQAGGAKQIADEQALRETLSIWLADPQAAAVFGEKAAQLMSSQNSVLEDYLQAIARLCGLGPEK